MKITLITVCYNAVATIEDTIRSVNSQTHPNVEYIVIDGSSSDGTLEILDTYKSNISKLISEKDNGIYDAMNKGLALANGEVVGFLNSDDIFACSTVLEQVANVFSNPEVSLCFADLVYVKKNNTEKIVRYWKSSEYIHGAFSRGWSPAHPTFYARKSVYENYGTFNASFKLAADIDLMMRFLEKAKLVSEYVPEVWVKMRMGGETNKSIKNIFNQNMEVIRSLKSQGIIVSLIKYSLLKILNRISQRWTAFCT